MIRPVAFGLGDPAALQSLPSGLFFLIPAVLLLATIVVMWQSIAIVDATERAVLTVRGEVRQVLEPGINFVIPFLSEVHRYDVRTQTLEVAVTASTDGEQRVDVEAVCYVRVEDPLVTFREVGGYQEAILEAARESLQTAIEESAARELRSGVGAFHDDLPSNEAIEELPAADDPVAERVRAKLGRTVEPWGIAALGVRFASIEPAE